MTEILRVEALKKSYDGFLAVNGVSFQVGEGELKALIGPNGAGKSTCFNMLNGQLKPTAGKVFLDGENITGRRPRDVWRKGVGRTFQITGVYQSMTVIENVQMALISHHRKLFSLLPAPGNSIVRKPLNSSARFRCRIRRIGPVRSSPMGI